MTPAIHVFIGVIGSGKDHNANTIKNNSETVDRIDFKDPLIEMVSDIVGYDISLDYGWFKDHPVGVMRPADPLQEAMLHSEWADILRKHPEIMTGRKMLTRVGTEAMRKRNPDCWVDEVEKRIVDSLDEGRSVVNADCRFFNEVERLISFSRRLVFPVKVYFKFCNYKSARYNPKLDHESEKMAQTLLSLRLSDGEPIMPHDFFQAATLMGKTFNGMGGL